MYDNIDESILDMMLEDPGMGDLYGEAVDKEAIRSILSQSQPDPEQGRHKAPFQIPVNGEDRVLVEVETGGMVAWLCLRQPQEGEEPVTQEEIEDALFQHQVKEGISEGFVARLLANPIYDTALIVARGVPPKDGIDGEIKYYFDTKCNIRLQHLDDDRIDFKELNSIQSVEKDDLVCELIPAQNGENGYNVRGEVLKAKDGVNKKLPVGKNTYASENGLMLYAACDGEVQYKGNQVSVDKVLKVENVDTSTGNLRFIGSIEVKGRICSGFTVKATEDIRVGDLIESANVSAGGSIYVTRGIKGVCENTITATGSVYTPFVENTHMVIGGNLEANVLMNADIECDGKIELKGTKGCMMGGHCRARQIEANQIGNLANIFTSVEIEGIEPLLEEIDQLTSDLMVQEGLVARLQRQINDGSCVDKVAVQKELLSAIYQKNLLASRKKQAEEKIEVLKQEFSFDIRVKEIFPNVHIKIGAPTYHNMAWNKGVMFFCMEDCIVTREYSG